MDLLAPRKNPATTEKMCSDGGEGEPSTPHLRRVGGRGILFRNPHSSIAINDVTGTF
jgi:hypothetical protein